LRPVRGGHAADRPADHGGLLVPAALHRRRADLGGGQRLKAIGPVRRPLPRPHRPLPTRFPARAPASALLLLAVLAFAAALGGQCRNERLLRRVGAAHHLHALLASLLLRRPLALPAGVTAVALGEHVLAKRADILPGDDPGT